MRWLIAFADAFCLWRARRLGKRRAKWISRSERLQALEARRRQPDLFQDGE